MKVYLTNHQANIENKRCVEKLRTELGVDVTSIFAKDSARNIKIQTLSVDISDNQIHMGNLPDKLKLYIGQELC